MSDKNTLFQHNTLAALMAGLYEGTLSLEQLLAHGDFGIGTLDSIDGELIIYQGKAYQAIGTGSQAEVLALNGTEMVPYAAVAKHRADKAFYQATPVTDSDLKEKLETAFPSRNLFYSIQIKGTFQHMHVRMIPKTAPGTRFSQVASQQPEFQQTAVEGVLVGFWTPELFHGVSVAGYHLHFLSKDHSFGGHVMDFVLEEGQVEIGILDALEQDFPRQNQAFLDRQFDVDSLREDITQSE
ncbi:acetolactate decarboxylase [Streptococcus halichoeri]|uniref:acetolactate decarboxylase n=1 Tax=Streptococcus halichoeri TaxID=254785 RepID=UPI00135BF600|nr:acetolactate decarboxylase [Streptococcus halichoeri]